MGRSTLMLVGAVLVVVGIVAFSIPVFVTQQVEDLAGIGDLRLQKRESTPHTISPLVSGSVTLLGVLLLAGGFYRRRNNDW